MGDGGTEVGVLVGVEVGDGGMEVGVLVGVWVGVLVGAEVGVLVGAEVGVWVGVEVGVATHHSNVLTPKFGEALDSASCAVAFDLLAYSARAGE